MRTRILCFFTFLAGAATLELSAQGAGFTAEVDGPWMYQFLQAHPQYKEAVVGGDFAGRILISDPSLYLYIRETAPEKAGVARPLTPEQIQAARTGAERLKRELYRANTPEAQAERARREELLRREAQRDVRPEAQDPAAVKERIHALRRQLHQAASPEEKQRLEAELQQLLHLYNQTVNPSNPQ